MSRSTILGPDVIFPARAPAGTAERAPGVLAGQLELGRSPAAAVAIWMIGSASSPRRRADHPDRRRRPAVASSPFRAGPRSICQIEYTWQRPSGSRHRKPSHCAHRTIFPAASFFLDSSRAIVGCRGPSNLPGYRHSFRLAPPERKPRPSPEGAARMPSSSLPIRRRPQGTAFAMREYENIPSELCRSGGPISARPMRIFHAQAASHWRHALRERFGESGALTKGTQAAIWIRAALRARVQFFFALGRQARSL